jgi:hypothetical protein
MDYLMLMLGRVGLARLIARNVEKNDERSAPTLKKSKGNAVPSQLSNSLGRRR